MHVVHRYTLLTVQRLEVTFARRNQLPGTRIESIEYILQLRLEIDFVIVWLLGYIFAYRLGD